MTKIRMWTRAYSPFVLGGDVHQPIACEVEVEGPPHDIGQGLTAYLVIAPDGEVLVVDTTTGGVVGSDLDRVRADLAVADPAVLAAQLAEEKTRGEAARLVPVEAFWQRRGNLKE